MTTTTTTSKDGKICSKCGFHHGEIISGTACPGCGFVEKAAPKPEATQGYDSAVVRSFSEPVSALGLIKRYFLTLAWATTRPSSFFERLPRNESIFIPLSFALLTHWIGSALQYLWMGVIGTSLDRYFSKVFDFAENIIEIDNPGKGAAFLEMKEKMLSWVMGVGSVISDPFFTILGILFTGFWVFLGARLLVTPGKNGAPSEITFKSAAQIVCYGFAPSILLAIPLVGSPLASLGMTIVTVVGAKTLYRIGWTRASIVGLFPKFLIMTVALSAMALFAAVILKFLAQFF